MKQGQIILEQLGGAGKLSAMIGANKITYSETALIFFFKGFKKSNLIRIELNASDLYNVKFLKFNNRTLETKEAEVFADVYAADLKRIIEEYTGLYLSL